MNLVDQIAGFTLLTLNLHCWQEEAAEKKLLMIADVITERKIDIICLQECGQHRDSPFEDGSKTMRRDNAALILRNHLRHFGSDYAIFWDWMHYGWGAWEEGLAVMSRYPLHDAESRYVSENRDRNDHALSRMALHARAEITGVGSVNVLCGHLSWQSAGLETQVKNLLTFADAKRSASTTATIIAGDFNDEPEGRGHQAMLGGGFTDCYRALHPRSSHPTTTTWKTTIDHVFLRSDSIQPWTYEILFDGGSTPLVSDHFGVLVRFRPSIRE